jgi:ABC-2 type transport system ATP-binding protein
MSESIPSMRGGDMKPPSPAGLGARIEARGLSRSFGDHVALAGVDLEIEPGEAFGLLGANGAGKTTFIRLVTGYLLPSEGSVEVDGVSPALAPRHVQQKLGFVAESSRLYPELKVEAFLRFAGGIRGMKGADLAQAVDQTIDRFQLGEAARRRIGTLSKGYKQRVSLAQAFLHRPSLLIVDEPTSGLDPLQQADVRATLLGLRDQCTILLCTHELVEARELTSRVAILNRGRLTRVGASSEVLGDDDVLDLFRSPEEGAR